MRCAEVMNAFVECCHLQDSAAWVAGLMRDRNIGFLPVCDDVERVSGVITDRDLVVRAMADGRDARQTPVEALMTRDVVACSPEDDLGDAEDLMIRHQTGRVVCVDHKGRAVGVISLADVARVERGERASDILRAVASREAHV